VFTVNRGALCAEDFLFFSAKGVPEKVVYFVIPSEARNLSSVWDQQKK
jgi:hypothetical protein